MTDAQQRKAAREFAEYWKDKGYEKGESQPFWLSLLHDVLGVEHPEQFITFEDQVHLDHTSFIDGIIPSTHVMIEQKGSGKNLMKAIRQSDGSELTPFQQAKRYSAELPYSQRPRWIVTCNFQTFHVYDMERPGGDPEEIQLADLEKDYYRLSFLTDTGNEHLKKEMDVSIAAGDIVGLFYNAFAKQYAVPNSEQAMKSLNVLCVRLVFCLYAEDAGIFGHHGMFHDYLADFNIHGMRRGLIALFKVLDQKPEDRDPYLADDNPKLAAFPYVDGGLFANEDIEIPPFTDEIRDLLLNKASTGFNWSEISPTIFGAVFESTLNPETRRKGGMHYTSIENIHKVIDPLFLDDLKKELEDIKAITVERTRERKLREFQDKLASLTFLDPACGSGNFLTETYLCLRRLENEVLMELSHGQISFGESLISPIKVSISQFYGIEINDFAVTVAKTALWIAESQMMKETEGIVHMNLDFLPLKTNAHIVEGNALRMDWENVVPKSKLNYIMGNPPFAGAMLMKGTKREDMLLAFPECKKPGELDYVAAWYVKAAKLIQNTKIQCAFVSTKSICQGQQVTLLWKPLIEKYGIKIDFAYRSFVWDSESNDKAHVHCIIVGFSMEDVCTSKFRKLFSGDRFIEVPHINGYLVNAMDVYIEARKLPICYVPSMHMGVMARDGGYLILSKMEYEEYINAEPQGKKFLRSYMMGREFLHKIERYCFWLVGANPSELQKCPLLMQRIERVKEYRLTSSAKETQKFAETPSLFCQLNQPINTFIAFPKVSSEKRRYIPIAYLPAEVIVGDKIYVVENITKYHFGVLTSNVHMAWMRVVCGRLKSDYSYSNTIVYNNFPWPSPTTEQKAKIEQTAQSILDARDLYPDSSLADLYDELTMPPELRKAHQNNDRAVMEAYGFPIKGFTEADCVAELMKMYQEKVRKLGEK